MEISSWFGDACNQVTSLYPETNQSPIPIPRRFDIITPELCRRVGSCLAIKEFINWELVCRTTYEAVNIPFNVLTKLDLTPYSNSLLSNKLNISKYLLLKQLTLHPLQVTAFVKSGIKMRVETLILSGKVPLDAKTPYLPFTISVFPRFIDWAVNSLDWNSLKTVIIIGDQSMCCPLDAACFIDLVAKLDPEKLLLQDIVFDVCFLFLQTFYMRINFLITS